MRTPATLILWAIYIHNREKIELVQSVSRQPMIGGEARYFAGTLLSDKCMHFIGSQPGSVFKEGTSAGSRALTISARDAQFTGLYVLPRGLCSHSFGVFCNMIEGFYYIRRHIYWVLELKGCATESDLSHNKKKKKNREG